MPAATSVRRQLSRCGRAMTSVGASSTTIGTRMSVCSSCVSGHSCPTDPLLEVQTGSVLGPLARDRVQIAFPHDQVVLPLDLDLELVLGVEQHPVADLDMPHARPDSEHVTPGQPPCH